MEFIPNNPYLEFHPDTLEAVREEFNLHQPGAMAEAVKIFEDWIKKQNHFIKKDFSKQFLETSIILAKGSLEKAKKTLDRLCTFKTLNPKYFSKYNAKEDIMDLSSSLMIVMLPKPTEDNYRVWIHKVVTADIYTQMFFDCYVFISLMCEYMKAHDYVQGFTAVVDLRDINVVSYAMTLNVVDLRHLMSVLMEGYGMRIKGIHFLSESKAIDTVITVFRQFVSPKVGKRLQVHKTLDSLYEHIPRDILPEDFGGKEKPLKKMYESMVDIFSSKENVEYFRDIFQPGTNEAYRLTATFNQEILGMPGSFRTLQVD